MNQTHFLHQLYDKFFPKNGVRHSKISKMAKEWENYDDEKKKKLSQDIFSQGEQRLLVEDLSALKLFDVATQLDPNNANLWYRQGLAFFEYASKKGREKILLLASKSFKVACQLDPKLFKCWWSWGNVLFELGSKKNECHYLLEAKKKYIEANKYLENETKIIQAEFLWDYATLWVNIAQHSGEAIDVRMAIQKFRSSFSKQTKVSAEFWNDFGNAYIQMGLLINDNRIYTQAIDFLNKAISINKDYAEAWYSQSEAYTQLYINTMNEDHIVKASYAFEKTLSLSHDNTCEVYLNWARLLGEAGKWNKNPKQLRLSLEKCYQAAAIQKSDPLIVAQMVESLSLLGTYTNRLDNIVDAEKKILEIIDGNEDIPELWYSYGVCMNAFALYYNDIEYEELAIEKYQIGLGKDRSNAEIWNALAYTHSRIGKILENEDLLQRACKFHSHAIDLKPACPSLSFDYALTLLKLSEVTEQKEYLEKALFQLEQTLSTQNEAIMQHPEWLFNYAVALDMMGDTTEDNESYYHKATEIFHHVLLIDPDFPKIHLRMALSFSHIAELSGEKMDYDKSINAFQMAIKQDPEDDIAWLEWGLTLISQVQQSLYFSDKTQSYDEAEQKIIRAGQLGNQQSFYHLACLYSLKNRLDEAMFFLKKASESEVLPSFEEMEEDEWLENLQTTEDYIDFIQKLETKQQNIADEK
jgi:tetratricopeptide (TPR) repeat protein